jgi:uncharacterized repeat protein (TIGR03803 family)
MLFRGALLGSTLAVAALTPTAGVAFSVARRPVTYTVLHNFAGPTGDGRYSIADVALDASGNIYGTTSSGGAYGAGVLFEVTPGGTESVVHNFGGAGDGITAEGAATIDASGNIYGATAFGGASNNGTLWELAADGTYTVLHSFASDEGSYLRGRLVEDKKGNLYGTALYGGANNEGTVFKYSSKGNLTVLHTFGGSDGENPESGVILDKAGNLYGTTFYGGAGGAGTVFEIARDGTFTTLHSFNGGNEGGFLDGGLAIDKSGNLYGSAVNGGSGGCSGYGCGTLFKLASDGTLTTLYSFTGGTDGANPEGDMLLVGKHLYSTALSGGAGGYGGVYKVTLKGQETMLHAFTESGGFDYSAGVTARGKTLYGTTEYGGTGCDDGSGCGVVFSLTK